LGFIVDKTLSFFGTGNSENVDKKKYESLTLSIRQTVLERSHHRCQKCSVKFRGSNGPFFEHINGSLKDNRPSNLRSLCDKCFEHVKKKESRKGFLGGMRNNLGQMFGN
jgi:5-methylcytosine-specific restriction endonuclease McrA